MAQARVHEACGPARTTLALWIAAQTDGAVVWITPAWTPHRLNSDGVRDWIDPARLVFVQPSRSEDLLWIMEEVLRAGACAFAVVELPALPTLTQVRRMHLAAETGAIEGPCPPTGLLLTPGDGGAAGVETRWRMSPAHQDRQQSWRLERTRARTAPMKNWDIRTPPIRRIRPVNSA
ncbi:MAG: ImuA family protein [Roseobacter sp.]